MSDKRPHHVVVEIDRDQFHSKLREIEAWLAEWEMDAEVASVLGTSGVLRIRFTDEKAAYAFQRCHGGRSISAADFGVAQAADASDENLYDRLAREYPD